VSAYDGRQDERDSDVLYFSYQKIAVELKGVTMKCVGKCSVLFHYVVISIVRFNLSK
jgi:hypothetical protein